VGVAWNDPALAIPWPVSQPIISEKDHRFLPLAAIDPARLPQWKG
jgi:dTDP-4-dehydrorhamnose 3,5-epimerase